MEPGIYNKIRHEIRYFLLRRLPTCQSITSLMSESLERPLSIRERVILNLHLLVCAWCLWYLDHLKQIRQILQSDSTETAVELSNTISLSAEARERIKRRLSTGPAS
jgi:hypothetical protein